MMFCRYCHNILLKVIINNELKKKCINCQTTENIVSSEDALIYETDLRGTNIISDTILKNISEDPISQTVMEKCSNCSKIYKKQFLSNDYKNTINICCCVFNKD